MAIISRNAIRRLGMCASVVAVTGTAMLTIPGAARAVDEVGPPRVPAPSRIDLGGLPGCGIPIHQMAHVEAYGPRSLDGVNVEGGGFLAISYGGCGNNFEIKLQTRKCSKRVVYTHCKWETMESKKFRPDQLPVNGRVTDVVSAPMREGTHDYRVQVEATYRTDLTHNVKSAETSPNKITRE